MMKPTIHLNGTSRDSLLENLMEANNALTAALTALRACAPNGRDYYPQGPNAIAVAINEHLDRVKKLETVQAEINAIAEAIA